MSLLLWLSVVRVMVLVRVLMLTCWPAGLLACWHWCWRWRWRWR
ncbi:hypothetical protein [Streptomyces violascens]